MRISMLLTTVIALGCLSTAYAADGEQKATVLESSLSKDSVKSACLGACTVNFRTELKVPLAYLSTIGSEIHAARETPDPVALAICARSLKVAEAVSGKQASVTSDAVMSEALALAKIRREPAELEAVAMLVEDPAQKSELDKLAKTVKRDTPEPGEVSKAIFGDLIVDNHTDHCLRIYVDGRYRGEVHAGQHAHLHVHTHSWVNRLEAYCEDDGDLVSQGTVSGHQHNVSWDIHE